MSLAIKDRPQTLKMISRLYSVMSWIRQDIDPANRWYPVFDQYLSGLGKLITGMNGDVTQIAPSPYGLLPPISTPGSEDGECDSERRSVGKIHGLRYDHFGDFEGFILETPEGHMRVFFSREKQMLEVITRAWAERLPVDVEEARPRIPLRVVLLPPSA